MNYKTIHAGDASALDRFLASADQTAKVITDAAGLDLVKIQRIYESRVTWQEKGDIVIDLADGDRVTVQRVDDGITVASEKSQSEAYNLSLQTAKFQKVLADLEALDAKLRGDEDA